MQAARRLIAANIPFRVLTKRTLDKLSDVRLLVLSNVNMMDPGEADAIRQWIQGGGAILATSGTSLVDTAGHLQEDFLLADVFGASIVKADWRPRQHYIAPTSEGAALFGSFTAKHPPFAETPSMRVKSAPGATVLASLTAAGLGVGDIDYVMCTHLHWDHVGWNTQLRDGRWVPTFPNAKYIFARTEWQAFEAEHAKHPQPQFLDSVLPIMEAGQAQLVEKDFALDDEVWLEPTPGHTPGHFCVRIASRGAKAVITGDCIHSPVQCVEPHWIMRADADPQLAKATRRKFLESVSDSDVSVCATHFPEPSIGRVTARDRAFWFEYRTEGALA